MTDTPQPLISLDDSQLIQILQKPYWSRRTTAMLIGCSKNTIKPWVEEVCVALKDFRAHSLRNGQKVPTPGFDLDQYQVWVLTKVSKLLAEFKRCKNGRDYFPEARALLKTHQNALSFQEFRYQVNSLKASA